MTQAPEVSVIVAVRDGHERLAGCLHCLRESSATPAEVIVVDDGSRGGSARVAEEYGVEVLRLGESRGPAAARNAGARAARHGVPMFLDADVRVHRDIIDRAYRALTAGDTIGAVFGGLPARRLTARYNSISAEEFRRRAGAAQRGPSVLKAAAMGAWRRRPKSKKQVFPGVIYSGLLQSSRMKVRGLATRAGVFWTVIALATVVKLILALSTIGSNDVLFFQAYARKVRAEGAVALYRDGIVLLDSAGQPRHPEGFAHPPFIVHFLEFLNWTRDLTGLSFPFLFRLLSILADIGSAVFLREILRVSPVAADGFLTACLFAGAPLLIFLSGFHGNTDPVMLFFLIVCVWCLSQQRYALTWLGGLAFGMSCNFKIWPLVLAPAVVLYIPALRHRLIFAAAALLTFLLCGLPVAVEAPYLVAGRMFEYSSLFGHWGLSRIFALTGPAAVLRFHQEQGRYLVMLAAIAFGIWMYPKKDVELPVRIGVVASMFLVLTPGFGIQYLSWLLPWVAFLGSEVMLIYLVCTAFFVFHVYSYWSNGLPWNLADSTITGTWNGFIEWHALLCWTSVLLCFFLFLSKAGILRLSFPDKSTKAAAVRPVIVKAAVQGGKRRRAVTAAGRRRS